MIYLIVIAMSLGFGGVVSGSLFFSYMMSGPRINMAMAGFNAVASVLYILLGTVVIMRVGFEYDMQLNHVLAGAVGLVILLVGTSAITGYNIRERSTPQ